MRGSTPVDVPSLLSLRDYDVVVRCLEVVRAHLPEIAPYSRSWGSEVIALCHHHPDNVYPALALFDADERAIDSLPDDIERWVTSKSVEWIVDRSNDVTARSWDAIRARSS